MGKFGFLIAIAWVACAAEPSATLISTDEAETIRSAIVRREAWTQDAADALRADAARRLKDGPWSVTAERPKGADADPHDYFSEPIPQTQAGQRTQPRFAPNLAALNSMANTVFTLSAAGYFLDNQVFAKRAGRVAHAWFLNPKTRMNPNMEQAQYVPGSPAAPASAVEGRAFIRAIQGLELLEQTGAWDARHEAAVRKWFEEYLRWLLVKLERHPDEPRGKFWWRAQAVAAASFVGDEATLKRLFAGFSAALAARRRGPAAAPPDLEAMAVICRVAQLHGVNLWTPAPAAYIEALPPTSLRADNAYLLALATMGLDKPEYLDAYRNFERPADGWLSVMDLLAARWEAAEHQTRH